MKLEHWIQTLLGSVILATLGFLSINLFEMKGLVSKVDTKVDMNDKRLSRIADTLPELKVKVAWEEVNYGFSGLVATTNPIETKKGLYKTYVNIYKPGENTANVYAMELKENHKDFLSLVIAGRINSLEGKSVSFEELKNHSAILNEAVIIPPSYNSKTSFLVRKASINKIEEYVKNATGDIPKSIKVNKMYSWSDTYKNLNDMENQLISVRELEILINSYNQEKNSAGDNANK